MHATFDQETKRIRSLLLPGSPVAIIGSSSFHHPESRLFCQELGRALAEVPNLVLLTGGVPGVGEAVGRAFNRPFEVLGQVVAPIFHILPEGPYLWDYGHTFYTGTTMEHRREVLGRLAGCYVVIEGGPGTQHEATVAASQGALVIPVGRFGGHAALLGAGARTSHLLGESAWLALGSTDLPRQSTVDTVVTVLGAWLASRFHTANRSNWRSQAE